MKRMKLFEWEDQLWLPQSIRSIITDMLFFFVDKTNCYQKLTPKLAQVLKLTNERQIVDLCSGSGGPWRQMQKDLSKQEGLPVSVILTDKFPHEGFRKISSGPVQVMDHGQEKFNIEFYQHSVDALEVRSELKGFRTLFTSFHHFTPDQAKKIIEDAVRSGTGIGIFEFTERSFRGMIPIFFSPLVQWLVTPFFWPLQWSRLLWTYLIPVAPFILIWDGLVSCLRTYSPEELKQMTMEFSNYSWDIGQVDGGSALSAPITYLIGHPKASGPF